jgi:8-oxo-dGTP diphosphatase
MPKSDQGVLVKRYQIIPRVLIFLTHENQVLLLKGAPDKRLWPNQYNGIGGHIERGEDVLTAARRELKEEAGLKEELWLCGTVMIDASEDVGIGIYVFRGEFSGRHEPVSSSEGHLEWVDIAHIHTFRLVEDLPTLLPVVFKTQPGMPPFSASYYYDEQDHLQIRFASTYRVSDAGEYS